jgi:NAD(P)-dependent dehydrogenase (short-subunit alcohol dehydrogenase family)
MKVLVTGATGFVGARLVQRLRNEDACQVLGAVRREHALIAPDIFVCGDIGPEHGLGIRPCGGGCSRPLCGTRACYG